MNVCKLISALAVLSISHSTVSSPFFDLEFIGEATFPTGIQFEGTEVGGLSGIDYDAENDSYIAISDDRAERGFARFYDLKIDLTDGFLEDGDVEFIKMTEILDANGESFNSGGVDPESIRIAPFPGTLFWSSEGDANNGLAPFVRIMTRDGKHLDEFGLPTKFFPTEDSGIRNNLAFESLTFSFDQASVFTATENALIQDGPRASVDAGSPVRVLQLDRITGEPVAEFIYPTEPVAAESIPAGAFSTNGLVELLSVSSSRFIAIERSFSVGIGNSIKIFLTNIKFASNVINKDTIANKPYVRVMKKALILDLAELGITLDNIEGVTFGPELASGEKTLILVSDNNFNPNGQFTQFLAFKIIE